MIYFRKDKPSRRVVAIRFAGPETISQIQEAFTADVQVIRPDLILVDGKFLSRGDYAVGPGFVVVPKTADWFLRHFRPETEQLEMFG